MLNYKLCLKFISTISYCLVNTADQNSVDMLCVMPCRSLYHPNQGPDLPISFPMLFTCQETQGEQGRKTGKWHIPQLHHNKSQCSAEKHALQSETRIQTRGIHPRKWWDIIVQHNRQQTPHLQSNCCLAAKQCCKN